jgi:hypothetical protein
MRCVNQQCTDEGKAFLCVDCDRVLHKAPNKRMHTRVRLLEPLYAPKKEATGSGDALAIEEEREEEKGIEHPLQTPMGLAKLLNHCLGRLRDLLDDRKVSDTRELFYHVARGLSLSTCHCDFSIILFCPCTCFSHAGSWSIT